MPKTIYFNIPATGHVNPSLPLMRELIARGEDVLYVNTEDHRAKIEATGLRFEAYPEVPLLADLMDDATREWNLARNMFTLVKVSGLLLPFVEALIEREKPDYILFDSLASWAKLAAEKKNLPHIAILATLALDTSSPPPFPPKAILDMFSKLIMIIPKYFYTAIRFRQAHGIFPVWLLDALMCLGQMNIVFTSREFQPNGASFPDNFKFVGIDNEPYPYDDDFPFDKLTGSPLIYISLGTISKNPQFFKNCFKAFGNHEGQFILATGHQQDIAELGEIPDNFIVRNFVPQFELLPKMDAFIIHGGLGSLHGGLVSSVPMLIVPQQVEQALNGLQVEKNGAGIVLNPNPPYGKVTVEQLQTGLSKILSSSEYKQNAKRLGETLTSAGGSKRAADEILAFVKK